ncbi:MAG: aminoglycoside phosphotransferase family protein [Phycisphaerales bacterium]|nr:aminoglycoside phosphotransferase family protein [Phycisphaerales bacterium]
MIELTTDNIANYLRARGAATEGEVLVKNLSGGVAGAVFMVLDMGAGEPVGTDMRTEGQKRAGKPDKRMREGRCFVVKQPLEKFNTAAEWLVDRDRIHAEHNCMALLHRLLPAHRVPEPLWLDETNFVLAMTAAPAGAAAWKSQLLAGSLNQRLADDAGKLLASIQNRTCGSAPIAKEFGELTGFVQQRIEPYFHATAKKHAALQSVIARTAALMQTNRLCLTHGDFSPKNMLTWPPADGETAQLMLVDFEVAHWGHPAFDVATLINHLLLKGFYHASRWRPFMFAADGFWQTYQQHAHSTLKQPVADCGGKLLGCLMLARVDGKSPVEYITDEALKNKVRRCAEHLLSLSDDSLDTALDEAAGFLD